MTPKRNRRGKGQQLAKLLDQVVARLDKFVRDISWNSGEKPTFDSIPLQNASRLLLEMGLSGDVEYLNRLIDDFVELCRVVEASDQKYNRDCGLPALLWPAWNLLRFLKCLQDNVGSDPVSDSSNEQKLSKTEKVGKQSKAVCSQDYRSVNWFGNQYTLTPTQAACFRVLYESWEQGTPVIGEQTILEAADSNSQRLAHVFAKGKHPAWGTLIQSGPAKGTFRLQEPTSEAEETLIDVPALEDNLPEIV
ncbi:MAG: hypothetical protein ACFCD0_13590 [Gemmataceae bacterium]